MNMLLIILFSLVGLCFGDIIPIRSSTTDPSNVDTLRIIDSGPLWPSTTTTRIESGISKEQQRSLDFRDNEDDADALQEFLTKYADKVKRRKNHQQIHELDDVEIATKSKYNNEKPKKWDLLSVQKHKHPYDDKDGWVSLEPIPWSVSKISRWHTTKKPPTKLSPTYGNDYDEYPTRPSSSWDKLQDPYYDGVTTVTIKPNGYDRYFPAVKPETRPVFTRPSAIFDQKVHIDYAVNNKDDDCENNHDRSDIITDGLPANFPDSSEAGRRRGSNIQSTSHPFLNDGEWVLLSTTKGYRYPLYRQRSLKDTSPQAIGTHRGVRLTVLPPSKNSKVNMTTSHGGLLQVESTFQTVEQAKNQYLQKQKATKKKPKRKIRRNKQQIKRVPQRITETMATPAASTATLTTTTAAKKRDPPDSSALLAAVGAGMIPATMAMLVPMAMNGKRRRKRDIPEYQMKFIKFL